MAECNGSGRLSRRVTRRATQQSNPSFGLAVALVLALVGTACRAESAVELPALDTVAQLNRPADVGQAYELEVVTRGDDQRRRLHRPVPVGSTESIEVSISGPNGDVAATVSLVVEASMADGSSQTVLLTIDRISASDDATDRALERALGSMLRVTTDESLMVVAHEAALTGELPDDQAFWVERLLEAPVIFAGPIPVIPVGEGATWTVDVVVDGASRSEERVAASLDAERSVVTITNEDETMTGVIESEFGRAVPTRQEVLIGEWETRTSVVG